MGVGLGVGFGVGLGVGFGVGDGVGVGFTLYPKATVEYNKESVELSAVPLEEMDAAS